VSYYLHRVARNILLFYRVARYRRQFDECGPGFEPLGEFVIANEGTLEVGRNFVVRSFAYQPVQLRVGKQGHLTIGDHVVINQGARISCTSGIVIGNNCLIGDEVLIMDSDWHGVGDRATRTEAVTIHNDVWLATRAVVLRGVTLGEGCVVAAGAIVSRSVAPFTLVAGVPAQPIRKLN
jgi:acetyltransferase-like isoleucine patch superfamily enzyme